MRSFRLVCLALLVVFVPRAQAENVITTVAGNGLVGFPTDGTTASSGPLFFMSGMAVDTAGNVFIAQAQISRVDAATGIITAIAGKEHEVGFSGDGGLATSASFSLGSFNNCLALDKQGNLYIADDGNHRVRKVDAITGIITTIAGNGSSGTSTDGILATSASLNQMGGITVDAAGNVYIAEMLKPRVRKVDAATGIITTVAGNGVAGTSGDGGAATAASLDFAAFITSVGICVDSNGNVYIGEQASIRKVDGASGTISTVLDYNRVGLFDVTGLALDSAGNLLIADYWNARIRKVNLATLSITTVAGGGTVWNDGCAATSALILSADGVAADGFGNVYLADHTDYRVRKIGPGSITDFSDSDGDGFSNSIEIAAGSSPTDPYSTPISGAEAMAGPLFIDSASLKLDFLHNGRDEIDLKGAFYPWDDVTTAGLKVVVDFGGITKAFTLDKKGNSPRTMKDKLTFKYNSKTGELKYTAKFVAGNFKTALADKGFVNNTSKSVTKPLPVIVLYGNNIIACTVAITYRKGRGKG
ncbi:MAG: hypothetical protein ABSE73_10420 [Planctomycetota bacterium]